jgi:hypothetical protein
VSCCAPVENRVVPVLVYVNTVFCGPQGQTDTGPTAIVLLQFYVISLSLFMNITRDASLSFAVSLADGQQNVEET